MPAASRMAATSRYPLLSLLICNYQPRQRRHTAHEDRKKYTISAKLDKTRLNTLPSRGWSFLTPIAMTTRWLQHGLRFIAYVYYQKLGMAPLGAVSACVWLDLSCVLTLLVFEALLHWPNNNDRRMTGSYSSSALYEYGITNRCIAIAMNVRKRLWLVE